MISFNFNVPKKQDKGEDALPGCDFLTDTGKGFLFSSDGAGGAGSRLYKKGDQEHTGAKLASVAVGEVSSFLGREWIEERLKLDTFGKEFRKEVDKRFKTYRDIYDSPKPNFRGGMIKEFPCTLSTVFFNRTKEGYTVNSFWAGDSRNYVCLESGFVQLTKDDLKTGGDPLKNLRDDSPMSNLIHGDGQYEINSVKFDLKSNKIVLISCTDGCFGYFKTPMDFELNFLSKLISSEDKEKFKGNLIEGYSEVSGDDFSMSFIAVGFESFSELKEYFSVRYNELEAEMQRIINKRLEIEKLKKDKDKLTEQIDLFESENLEEEDQVWEVYKQKLMSGCGKEKS